MTPQSHSGSATAAHRADQLFAEHQHEIHRRNDRLFAGLMAFQWVAGILFALWVSPLAWEGPVSRTHVHVWAAIFVGGAISLFPALLGWLRPGVTSTRFVIAIAQMLMGALLIHLTGGRIETHFHVFGSLAFLAFYRDWRVLIPATVVVALDHLLRGWFWPQSVYGVAVASQWRWVEHAAWVVFEDIFLIVASRRSLREMRETAERTAALEHEVRTRQEAEHEAHAARARNDAILEVALDCVILMDTSGRVAQFNPAAERTFGYRAREAVGMELGALIVPPAERPSFRESLAGHLDSGDMGLMNQRLELTAVRKGGEVFPVEVVIAPISSQGTAMFAGYMRDITERVRAERELARYTQDLEAAHETERQNAEQLVRLVEQLRAAQRQAESATRAKSNFLASMSHELRTPLNAIILYSELLQEEAAEQGPSTTVADLERILAAGKHLLDLINGILDLSKIEAGKMGLSLETFAVRPVLDDLSGTLAPLVEKNQNTLTIRCDDRLRLTADLMKTRQIVLNLLSNAIKFTRDGAITVDVSHSTYRGRASVAFTVTDTGVGMSADQTGKIFDAFTQADVTTTRKYGGTGLGLAIVSRLCDLMGGHVSVQSHPGSGSQFTVHLPVEVTDRVLDTAIPASAA